MRGSRSVLKAPWSRRAPIRRAPGFLQQTRAIRISSARAPASRPDTSGDAFGATSGVSRDSADARFETIPSPAAPSSLLSVDLSASQQLFTRRGTLVGATGELQNVNSRLSLLSPLRRAFLGIPFLYQRISSTTPITLLIGAKSPATTISLLHLDGTTDWQIVQRNALLAWTGHTMSVTPRTQRGMPFAHWGNTFVRGRGVAALASPGQVYQVSVAEGEQLVVHPSHIVAYSVTKAAPQPFRFKSSSVRFQVPAVPAYISRMSADMVPAGWSKFTQAMRESETYKFLAGLLYALRTNARRSIWGDRLFLQFRGPATLLMSSRGVRVADVLTRDDVNEIADAEAGVVPAAIEKVVNPPTEPKLSAADTATSIHIATVERGGKVQFEETKDLKQFVQQ